jgi:hypothetical protein
MAADDNSLLALIEALEKKAPEYLQLLGSKSDVEFEKAFDVIFEKALRGLEKNSKNFSSLDEEGLTAALALALSVPGLRVTQEANSNGHVDITIEADHLFPSVTKLGEAKIYDGPEYHIKGLGQLLGRYTTGRESTGIVLAYVRKANIEGLVKKIRERMDQDLPELQQGATEDHPSYWSFLSKHQHSCGRVLSVRHAGCNMHVAGGAAEVTTES